MPLPEPATISRFVELYKGIEDFYFLNRHGELGYIRSGVLRSVKETFPQLRERDYFRSNHEFLSALENFLRELGEIADTYTQQRPSSLELGYILPVSDQYLWRSASLVLHKHVLETMKTDHETMLKNGDRDLAEAGRDLSRIMGIRGIHQGLDELTFHHDAYGEHRYFPVLYVQPPTPATTAADPAVARVRVINLRWRGRGLDAQRRRSGPAAARRELIFRMLRDNLTRRGAIDRSQRMEQQRKIA